jgi:hypothetical protein
MVAKEEKIPQNVLTNPGYKFWRTDTRAIVGAVLLAVCFTVNMQLTERIDTALAGGVIYWFGTTFCNIWFICAVLNFGMTGGLLAANFNPIIAVLTATSPMAPRFFLDNTLYVIPAAFMVSYFFKTLGYIDFKRFFLIILVAVFADSLAFVASWVILFKFPPLVILGLWALMMTTAIPGALLAWPFCKTVAKSGVADLGSGPVLASQ